MKKVYLLIGAGPGIGAATADQFAQRGYHVALCSRNTAKLDKLKERFNSASSHSLDVADHARLASIVEEVEAKHGAVDVLHFNAYDLSAGRASNLGAEKLRNSFNVNIVSALAAAQAVIPFMTERGKGTILFTGGGYGLHPDKKVTALSVCKAGLRALAMCLNQELSSKGIHAATVTVCGTVEPGGSFDPVLIAKAFLALHDQTSENFDAEFLFTGT